MRRSRTNGGFRRFIADVLAHTPVVRIFLIILILWLLFSAAFYFAERGEAGSHIHHYGDALYWSVAAFSTAGIADTPVTGMAKLVGGLWIVIGSGLFFGAIVASITGYFMRPLQRPHKKIIETIEYNLEQLEDLSVDELDLLKETVDGLIDHVEALKLRQAGRG